MTRALCYGGTVVDKRPIFQPIVMWAAVILSALLHVSPEKTELSDVSVWVCVSVSVSDLSPSVIRYGSLMLCCSPVCGRWSSWLDKGHLFLFFSQYFSPHIPCPQHRHAGWGLSSSAAKRCYHRQAPFPCSFISSVSVSDCVGVSGAGVPLLSLTPLSLSLSLSPAHPPSVCWRGPGSCWALTPGPLCVLCVCVTFDHPSLRALCYRWDLRLSVSASAARRRRKQDARGSTVISQCALFRTIPGRSLYSLHAGLPLDIYMCQQSHSYWPT